MRPVIAKAWRRLGALLALWLLLMASALAAAELKASVDRQQLGLDETVQLQLNYSGTAQEQPDLSPLEQDFEIVGSAQRSMIRLINGERQSSMGWVLRLAPKRSGQLQIPALQLGQARSEPLTIVVTDVAVAQSDGELPLFVVADISPEQGFEQSEFRYRLRIFSAVTIREGSLSEPQAEGAQISREGDEKRYQERRGGRDYLVIERNFRLQPQRSGELQIPPQVLDARITAEESSYSSTMEMLMDQGRVVRLRSNPVTVAVKPRPAAVTGWFLPARAVALSQRWQPQPPQLKVGEAITRVIRLEAQGATPAQLPQLTVMAVDGARQYLEQEESRSEDSDAGRVAVLEQAISLIPLKPGPLTLPELRVEWWDIDSDSPQVAVLPATTLQVSGSEASADSTAGQPTIEQRGDSTAAAGGLVKKANASQQAEPQTATDGGRGGWLLALLAMAVVAAAGIGWLWQRTGFRQAPSPMASARQQLLQACKGDDARAISQALARFQQLGGQLPAGAQCHVDQLHAAAYGPRPQPWSGQPLARLLAAGRRLRQQSTGQGLPPLYPQ